MRGLGPVVLVDSLPAEQVNRAPAYFNARYLLEAASSSPIPATKTLGGLTQSFVERAVAEMHWPDDAGEIVRYVGSSPEERDVPRLRRLRVALQTAGLLRTYRGAFHATVRGRGLLAPGREGELYLALFEAYLTGKGPRPASGGQRDTWVQQALPAFLWLLLVSADSEISIGEVASGLADAGKEGVLPAEVDNVELAGTTLRQTLLEPMEDLGLVELATTEPPFGQDLLPADTDLTVARVTPLFERFVIAAARLN
jgi:hypothetical protein